MASNREKYTTRIRVFDNDEEADTVAGMPPDFSDNVFDELPMKDAVDAAVYDPASVYEWHYTLNNAALIHYGMQMQACLRSPDGRSRVRNECDAAMDLSRTAIQNGDNAVDALTLHDRLQTVSLSGSCRLDKPEVRTRDARKMWERTLPNVLAVKSMRSIGMLNDAKIMDAFNGSQADQVLLEHAYRFRQPVNPQRITEATQAEGAVGRAFEMGILPPPELIDRAIREGRISFSPQELDYLEWFMHQMDPENDDAVPEPLLTTLTVMDAFRSRIAPMLRGDGQILRMPKVKSDEPEISFLERINQATTEF